MTKHAELIREIDRLPTNYYGKVYDFVSYLQKNYVCDVAQSDNADEIAAYKAMAADTEREQEAREWCNSYFGPAYNK